MTAPASGHDFSFTALIYAPNCVGGKQSKLCRRDSQLHPQALFTTCVFVCFVVVVVVVVVVLLLLLLLFFFFFFGGGAMLTSKARS